MTGLLYVSRIAAWRLMDSYSVIFITFGFESRSNFRLPGKCACSTALAESRRLFIRCACLINGTLSVLMHGFDARDQFLIMNLIRPNANDNNSESALSLLETLGYLNRKMKNDMLPLCCRGNRKDAILPLRMTMVFPTFFVCMRGSLNSPQIGHSLVASSPWSIWPSGPSGRFTALAP